MGLQRVGHTQVIKHSAGYLAASLNPKCSLRSFHCDLCQTWCRVRIPPLNSYYPETKNIRAGIPEGLQNSFSEPCPVSSKICPWVTGHSTVLCIWKLLKEQILKVLITSKITNNNSNWMRWWILLKILTSFCKVYLYQIILLYTLNLYNVIYQLCLSKSGRKSILKSTWGLSTYPHKSVSYICLYWLFPLNFIYITTVSKKIFKVKLFTLFTNTLKGKHKLVLNTLNSYTNFIHFTKVTTLLILF